MGFFSTVLCESITYGRLKKKAANLKNQVNGFIHVIITHFFTHPFVNNFFTLYNLVFFLSLYFLLGFWAINWL